MKRNTKHNPNNSNSVSVQMDARHAATFFKIQKTLGLNISETIKCMIYPTLESYESQISEHESEIAAKLLNIDQQTKLDC